MARNVVEIILAGKDEASRVISGVEGKMGGLGKAAKVAGAAVAAGLALAVTASVRLAQSVGKSGDEIAKMSRRTGLATEALSQLAFAAEQSGTDVQTLENGFRRLQRNVSDAEAGLTTSIRAFERLNIEWKTSDGRLRELDDLLPEIADGMNQLETDTERAATAQELFGRAGTALIPLLAEGSKGIADLRIEADALGRTWSGPAAKAAEDFVDAQNRMKSSLTGVKNLIGQELMPIFTDIADRVSTWVSTNRELIAQDLKQFFENAIEAAGEFARVMGKVIEVTGEFFFFFSEEGKIYARLVDLAKEREKLLKKQSRVQWGLNQLEEGQLSLADRLNISTTDGLNPLKFRESAQRRLLELQGELNDLQNEEIGLNILLREQSGELSDEEQARAEAARAAAAAAAEEREREIAQRLEIARILEEAEAAVAEGHEFRVQMRREEAEIEFKYIDKREELEAANHAQRMKEIGDRRLKTLALFDDIGNAIATTAADSFTTFLNTGKMSMDKFGEHAKRVLTKLALHKFFKFLANATTGGAGGGIFGTLAGFFGQQGGFVPGYQSGGFVGGLGSGDRVHAMLEPGELIIPKRMAEKLMAGGGGSGGGGDHFHFHTQMPMSTEQQVEAARWIDDVLIERGRSF